MPALLPEVSLRWDPQTVRERGRDSLLRFRMDFLLLLPHGVRVVIEIDGKHHYANARTGVADVCRCAEMVAADRELMLAGYHVFRFGAVELHSETADDEVKAFFVNLFRQYKVISWDGTLRGRPYRLAKERAMTPVLSNARGIEAAPK
ncbi:hypothetical protein [Paraburkholderia sp.]|uniref:hypothetical protein n=1 Tax=Paraburkholderia sp. TaxID=1926495 RepID=UPI003C7C8BBF